MSTSPTKTVILKSSDGEYFPVEEPVAVQSQTIKNMIESGWFPDGVIDIYNVSGKILSKVIDYCRGKHFESTAAASPAAQKKSKAWEYEFARVDPVTLHDLNQAAQSLRIPGLLDLTFEAVTNMIPEVVKEEARKILRTDKSYTKEQKENLLRICGIPIDPPKEVGSPKKRKISTEEEGSLSRKLHTSNLNDSVLRKRHFNLNDSLEEERCVLRKQPINPNDSTEERDSSKNHGKKTSEPGAKDKGKEKIIID